MSELTIDKEVNIKDMIYTFRGIKVVIDSDLAKLYGVETRYLNKSVKRNIERFPIDFCFHLNTSEFEDLKFQFGTSSWGGVRKMPYAFTEQGIAMLSGVLRSKKAVEVNIKIMRAFISMRKLINSNDEIYNRVSRVENKQLEHDGKFEVIFNAMNKDKLDQEKGIFYEGEMFDAYNFLSDIIRSAKKSILLIDNYVDDSVLTLFRKRKKGVAVKILTKNFTKQLKLDLEKYNSQYEKIVIEKFTKSHDRFLIIDDKDVYHIGASLKDLGKKWVAFSKFDREMIRL